MNRTNTRQILATLGFTCVFIMLTSCSSSPQNSWTKQSPWDQRKDSSQISEVSVTEALPVVDQASSEVELSYQPEPMESEISDTSTMDDMTQTDEYEPESMSPEDEILNQPADFYTVQLIASVDEDRVLKFAEKNQISIRYIIPTVRDGITWHVLLLDIYPDSSSAKAGLDEVVDSLSTQPWIRSLGSIQKLMQ